MLAFFVLLYECNLLSLKASNRNKGFVNVEPATSRSSKHDPLPCLIRHQRYHSPLPSSVGCREVTFRIGRKNGYESASAQTERVFPYEVQHTQLPVPPQQHRTLACTAQASPNCTCDGVTIGQILRVLAILAIHRQQSTFYAWTAVTRH